MMGAGVPYVERFMHYFRGNILIPQCVIVEGTVRTGPPHPSKSKLVWLITRAGDELQSSRSDSAIPR
jgi:hypothetical protein